MSALVQRLRKMRDRDGHPDHFVNPDGPEAADAIEALTVALRNIECRTSNHSDDTPKDDARDKRIANTLARAALAKVPS